MKKNLQIKKEDKDIDMMNIEIRKLCIGRKVEINRELCHKSKLEKIISLRKFDPRSKKASIV